MSNKIRTDRFASFIYIYWSTRHRTPSNPPPAERNTGTFTPTPTPDPCSELVAVHIAMPWRPPTERARTTPPAGFPKHKTLSRTGGRQAGRQVRRQASKQETPTRPQNCNKLYKSYSKGKRSHHRNPTMAELAQTCPPACPSARLPTRPTTTRLS